jgi:hypothetical protein
MGEDRAHEICIAFLFGKHVPRDSGNPGGCGGLFLYIQGSGKEKFEVMVEGGHFASAMCPVDCA